MIPHCRAAKNRDRAKLALRRRSTGYTSVRTRPLDLPVSAGCSLGHSPPLAAVCSPEFRQPERGDALLGLPGARLAAGCSRRYLSRKSIADCGPSAPAPEERPLTLLRSGPSFARRRQQQSDRGRHRLVSAASTSRPQPDLERLTRPRLAPRACPDKVRSGLRVVLTAPR